MASGNSLLLLSCDTAAKWFVGASIGIPVGNGDWWTCGSFNIFWASSYAHVKQVGSYQRVLSPRKTNESPAEGKNPILG